MLGNEKCTELLRNRREREREREREKREREKGTAEPVRAIGLTWNVEVVMAHRTEIVRQRIVHLSLAV
jgi:hypothetical protein